MNFLLSGDMKNLLNLGTKLSVIELGATIRDSSNAPMKIGATTEGAAEISALDLIETILNRPFTRLLALPDVRTVFTTAVETIATDEEIMQVAAGGIIISTDRNARMREDLYLMTYLPIEVTRQTGMIPGAGQFFYLEASQNGLYNCYTIEVRDPVIEDDLGPVVVEEVGELDEIDRLPHPPHPSIF